MQKPTRGFLGRANVPEFEENFEKIDAFRTHKYRQFGEKSIDLEPADLSDEEVEIEANGIFIKYPVDVDIRVNDLDAPKINALQFRYIGGYVHKIFITSERQNPKLEIITGVNSEIGFLSNSSKEFDAITGTATNVVVTVMRWYCLPYAGKKINIKNTGDTNNLGYVIYGYTGDKGQVIHTDTTTGIDPGETEFFELPSTYNEIYVQVVYLTAATTYEINYAGTTQFGLPNFTVKEDTAHVSGDYGVPSMAVRKDSAAALAGSDGDYAPLEVDANGRLHVIGGSVYAEDTPHTSGDKGSLLLGVRNDTPSNLSGTNLDYTPFSVDQTGKLWVRDQYVLSALHREDDAMANLDYGFSAMAVRRDTPASSTSADGDYSNVFVTDEGRLHTEPNDVGTGVGAEDTTVGSTSGTFAAQAFKKGCMIVVNDMGTTNTWIEIRIGSGKTKCTAAGQGIDWMPIANANEITVIGDGADDGKVSYTGV